MQAIAAMVCVPPLMPECAEDGAGLQAAMANTLL